MASRSSSHSSLRSERLLGKVAVVTGGANGIGESIVCSFLRHGAKVCVADIQDDVGRRLVNRLGHDGFDTIYCHCDVTVEENVKRAVDLVVDKYGSLDIMINNAGVAGLFTPDIRDVDITDMARVLDVNVKGVFAGLKHAARVMIPKKAGSIVSMCSIAGATGGGPHAYTASKHAVLGLTRSAAGELGKHGIRVNCVSPYAIITGMASAIVPKDKKADEEKMIAAFGRVITESANLKGVELTANDVANAVVYLVSDEARYVSGANLVVDGGVTVVTNAFRALEY